jgi:hypothetical protein
MAYDSAGTNDGTVYGAIWTTGQINGALSFDGLNDYVCVPDNYSLDLGTHDLSFAFWFKTNESSIKQILTKRSTTTGPSNRVWDGYGSALFEDGTVAVWFRHSASSDSGVIVSSTASYNDGNWHHLAGVYTRSANLELYVDGVPEGTPGDISYAENKDINLTQPLAIGCRVVHGRSNDLYFNGTIDDVRIYDRPLSAAEIMELYSLSDMGPIAHWKFDEGSGTTAYDSAGTNDGTVYGVTWTTGQIDGALSFDGVDDYVEIGPGVMPVGEKSLFSWVKMPPVGQCSGVDCDYLIYHGIDSDAGGTVLYYNNGVELRWFNPHSGGFDAKHTVAIDNNQWHFVGFVYDGGVYRLYLDGNDIASSTGGDHSTIISYEGIGGFNGDYLLRSWYGIIDDVRIYDRALSAEEILALYKGIITVGLDITRKLSQSA